MAGSRDARIAVPCPDCGEMSEELVESVAVSDVLPCSLCGGLIDLSAPECRAQVEAAKTLVSDAGKAR